VVHRWSSGTVSRCSALLAASGLVLVGLADSILALIAALAYVGLALGALDICMNTQAVAVERGYGRPILTSFHGVYSLGILAGGGVAAIVAGASINPPLHFALVGCVMTVVVLTAGRHTLGADADRATGLDPQQAHAKRGRMRLRDHPRLIAVGAIAACSFFAEGAVDSWSGVLLHNVHHASYAVASLGLTLAGVGMTVGRFTGDAVIARFGRRRTIAWSGCIASGGIALALAGGSSATALVGFGCFGIGVATIVPTAFYVAGNTRRVPPVWGLAQVTTMGYAGLLSSPTVIGFVSHAAGLTWALAIPATLLLLVPALSPAVPGRSDHV
jgi:fucose permease